MNIEPVYEYDRISKFYGAMDEILGWPEQQLLSSAPDISKWSIAQQIVHICMSNSGMWRSIGRILSEKEPAVASATTLDVAVEFLEKGEFPRNSIHAPTVVQPEPDTGFDEIQKWSRVSRMAFQRMADIAPALPEKSYYLPHPILGHADARTWLRMIRIHAEHHLAIIRDIDEAAA